VLVLVAADVGDKVTLISMLLDRLLCSQDFLGDQVALGMRLSTFFVSLSAKSRPGIWNST
jgi:hypothetical protein